jgi:hypothetical protein
MTQNLVEFTEKIDKDCNNLAIFFKPKDTP